MSDNYLKNRPGPTVQRFPEVFIMISSLVYRPIPFHGLKNSWLIVYGPYYMVIIDLIKQILSKCAFNLPNINSRVQRTADVHQDFSFKQFVLW